MDQTIFSFQCGSQTTYGDLKKCQKISCCIMCDKEDLDVNNFLNRPENRFILKEKELELEIENLRLLNQKLFTIKQDPRFYVEKSFDRIFNELELRKEEVKKSFDTQINEYYDNIRKNLEYKQQSIINDINENLIEKIGFVDIVKQESYVDEDEENIKIVETQLNKIGNETNKLKRKLSNIVYSENLKLFFYE